MGNRLNNPNIHQTSSWKIINKVMNKCKAPKIPPLLVNNLFILNCREKAKLFTDFFSQQCNPVINHSTLPNISYLTNEKIEQISINEAIISLIRKLNTNKANGLMEYLEKCFSYAMTRSFYPSFYQLLYIPIFGNLLM